MASAFPMPTGTHIPDAGRAVGLAGRPIIVAADLDAAASAAARVADSLVFSHGARPHVVHAFDMSSVAMRGPVALMTDAVDALLGPAVHGAQADAMRRRVEQVAGHAVDWPVHISAGWPASVIVREADSLGAALIVMGIREHGRANRLVHGETTLGVIRRARCPVIAVRAGTTRLPRRVIVGMDFSPTSVCAAQWAAELVAPYGVLVLAYVAEHESGTRGAFDGAGPPPDIDAAFDRVLTTLALPADVVPVRLQVNDDSRTVADNLLAAAVRYDADLIAIGTRRCSWLERALAGSTSTPLARQAPRALLVVPPSPPAP